MINASVPPLKKREYHSITIAKGIAIILMVLGHSGCPDWMHDFIYMFHMPLFLGVSGYCFKEEYFKDAKSFVIKRIKGLYIPFVKWGIIFVLFHNLFYELYMFNNQYCAVTPIFYTYRDIGDKMLMVL